MRCPAEQLSTGGRVAPETKTRVGSWAACAQLCRERLGCRYWTWDQGRSRRGHTCVTMTHAAKLYGTEKNGNSAPQKVTILSTTQ